MNPEFLTSSLLFVIFVMGIFVGCLVWDFKDRWAQKREMISQIGEVKKAAAVLVEAHNNVTHQLQLIGDKVSGHEFALKQRVDQNPLSGKRFP